MPKIPPSSAERPFLLDVSRLIWRLWSGRLPTGIDRVCQAYVQNFGSRSLAFIQRREFRYVLNAKLSDELFLLLLQGPSGFRGRFLRLIFRAIGQRQPIGHAGRIYLNVGHTGLDAEGLGGWLRRQGLLSVFLIHDLIPITHPEFCRPGESERHVRRMANALTMANGIIANSRDTLAELTKFAASRGEVIPESIVSWLGTEAPAKAADVSVSNRPYFVTIGTIEARKNHRLLLSAWRRLIEEMGNEAPLLVLIGQRGWEADDVFAMLDEPSLLDGHVLELGRCDDPALAGYLDGAQALLMPSFAEGFGLPVVEALVRGVPVIASDLAVFREIAGDVPLYLDPCDEVGWMDAIRTYAANGVERDQQLDAATQFRAPTWADHFAKVEHWLQRLRALSADENHRNLPA